MQPLTRADFRRLLEMLNEDLRQSDTRAEIFLVGGAVMCYPVERFPQKALPALDEILARPSGGP